MGLTRAAAHCSYRKFCRVWVVINRLAGRGTARLQQACHAIQDGQSVLEDYGRIGRAYREVDEEKGDRETLIRHQLGCRRLNSWGLIRACVPPQSSDFGWR
ncbi:MAG: hypothetical protein QOH35_5616 [Acidobacteriaceae bacterium]|jgi:hypothetical protein|nr:hypothetical protein [Acidobacteriaceae bacterium]MEA2544250.1 hypothetical protein [Acidobacteriaceae bacterium]